MSLYRHPDASIAEWLADGPVELSSPARRAISSEIRTIRQRRPIVLWRPSARQTRLVAVGGLLALALALAVAAGAARLLLPPPAETATPTNTAMSTEATHLPATCAGASPSSPEQGRGSVGIPGVKVWIDYCQAAQLAVYTGSGARMVGFGSVPGCLGDRPAAADHGVVVADVTGAKRHGSLIQQPQIGTDAETFLRDLDVPLPYPPQNLVIDFEVDDVALTQVAGATAWSARVAATIVPWASHLELPFGATSGCLEFGTPNRVWVFDVGRSIVVVQAWASDEPALAAWLPEATRFIDALRLRADGPSTPFIEPTPSPGPAN
jgi:hypothetical protein